MKGAALPGAVLAILAAPAMAQDVSSGPLREPGGGQAQGQQGILVYDSGFFASGSPNSAFDMIQRIPGFGLDIGNSGARGLAGSVGNVLIDGNRPSSKSDGLDQILQRIPASSVERIELVRGGAPGIDMQGRPVVANIVLKKAGTTQLTAESNTYFYPDGGVGPQLRLSHSNQKGERQTEAAIFATIDRTGGTAHGHRTRFDAAGQVTQEADLDLWDRLHNVNARGSIQRRVAGGKLRINALADFNNSENRQEISILSGAGFNDRNEDEGRNISGELGANWTRSLGSRTEVEITGLQRLSFFDYDSASLNASGPSTFDIASTSGESILRSVLRFRPSKQWAFEGGGEVAYNFLDSTTSYTQNEVPVALPNAQVFVSELRGEAFGQGTWQASPTLTLEAGLRAEVSRISQSGDTDRSKSFFYPKPRLQATWRFAPGHQLRGRIQREVGQLRFSDFVAATEVNLGTVTGGNADLEPQKETIFEAAYEHRFWGKGVFELTGQYRKVDDIIDVIPLEGGFEAIGNIGDGVRGFVQLRLSLPLDRLGLSNALLHGRGSIFWSRATDPLTGEARRFSGEVPFGCGVSYTQDLKGGRFAYGFEHGCNVDRFTNYRIRELRRNVTEPYITLHGSWKPRPDLTVKVELGNITNSRTSRLREVHSGFRHITPVTFSELRETRQDQWLFLQLRKVL